MSIGLNRLALQQLFGGVLSPRSVASVQMRHFLHAALAVGDDAAAELTARPCPLGLSLSPPGCTFLAAGVFTSSIEMVRPDCEA